MACNAFWISVFLVIGCGGGGDDKGGEAAADRQPGPHSNEEGKVTFWKVLGVLEEFDWVTTEVEFSNCTDQNQEDVADGPEFSDSSYLMYSVEPGGDTATGQSCEALDSSTCTDSEIQWDIDGHVLTHLPELEPNETSEDCQILMHPVWTFIDEGETGLLVMEFSFEYDGDPESCEALEVIKIEESTNGYGFADCLITMTTQMEFALLD